jgi:small subunit ribosomal protein S25e
MGGTKKKTLAGMEKEQSRRDEEEEKKKKESKTKAKGRQGGAQPHLTFTLKEEETLESLKGMKAVTVYGAAKALNVRASVASMALKALETKGRLKRVGGFSGHYVYSLLA